MFKFKYVGMDGAFDAKLYIFYILIVNVYYKYILIFYLTLDNVHNKFPNIQIIYKI